MKKNILFALAVILLAGVIAVTRVMTRTEGTTARVEITDAETITLPLDKDGTYEISEGKLPVTLEVSEGRIRFINSRCPGPYPARATAGFQKSTTRPSVCPRALWYRWKKAPDGHPARRRGNVQFL